MTSRHLHRWTVEQLTQEREALAWQQAELEATLMGSLPNDDPDCGDDCILNGITLSQQWLDEIDAELEKRRKMLRGGYGPKVGKPQSTDIFRTVKERVDLVTFCERHGPNLRQVNRDSWFALCPFPDHNETTGSFHVTPSKGLWNCFGCGRGGDVLHLGMMVYGVGSVVEAAKLMAKDFGIDIEPPRPPQPQRGRVTFPRAAA
jgi:hypothetical protein